MEELKPYIVEFDKNGAMKPKVYSADCAIGGNNRQPVIIITHDKCTFSANNGIQKAWTQKGVTFLRPKDRGQGIMVSKFILSYGQLNLASLTSEERETIQGTGLLEEEVVEIFKYRKNNDSYWDGTKLYQQVFNKALPIVEAFYLGYSLFFSFDNAISHSVYVQDAL